MGFTSAQMVYGSFSRWEMKSYSSFGKLSARSAWWNMGFARKKSFLRFSSISGSRVDGRSGGEPPMVFFNCSGVRTQGRMAAINDPGCTKLGGIENENDDGW